MKRLKFLMIIFFIGLSIPLAYFILHTYQSLEQEEIGELQYFAATLFDAMEEELTALLSTFFAPSSLFISSKKAFTAFSVLGPHEPSIPPGSQFHPQENR